MHERRRKRPARGRLVPPPAPAPSTPADAGLPADLPTRPPTARDDDRDASQRMELAALMLRRGDDVNVVAADTDVPVAMLELLRAELEAAVEHRQDLRWEAYRRRSVRTWRTIIVAVSIEIVALANIVACITAFLRHDRALGLLTGVVAAALMVAVYLIGRPLARTLRPPAADQRTPPPPQRWDG